MTKLSVTYRASIDRTVPITVRAELPSWMGGAKKKSKISPFRSLFARPRVRVTA